MPEFIKTAHDEDLWEKAKTVVHNQYHLTEADGDEFYRLVTGVYKKAGGSVRKSLVVDMEKAIKATEGKITRKQATSVHKDLPPGGAWRTIRGHHVYIKDGKVLAGSIPGARGAKKSTKAHLKEYQAHIDKEGAGQNGSNGSVSTRSKSSQSKPKTSTGKSKGTTSVGRGTSPKSKTVGASTGKTSKSSGKQKPTSKTTSKTKKTAGKSTVAEKSKSKSAKGTNARAGAKNVSGKSAASPAKLTASAKKKKTAKDIRTEAQKNRDVAYDAGDKIGGARKDTYVKWFKDNPNQQNLQHLIDESPEAAIKMVTKANILKPVDFDQERKNGVDVDTAMLRKLIYDRISPKPRSEGPEELKAYMLSIQKLQRHLAGIKDFDTLWNALRELRSIARDGSKLEEANQALARTGSYARHSYINEDYYKSAKDKGEKAKKMLDFSPLGDKLENFFTNYESMNRTMTTLRKKKLTWENFGASEAKKAPKPKGEQKKRWERKTASTFERTGGRDTKVKKPEDMLKQFNMKGVEFGHWVDDAAGMYHLKRSAEAFRDLADLIGVDDKDISLNGRLSVAFGARGKGGALAHYEPDRKAINMTKFGGAGSLAHEWGHAMDNILYQFSQGGKPSIMFASGGQMGHEDPVLYDLYDHVRKSMYEPAPGDKGGVKTIQLDSSAKPPAKYYPEMRRDILNEGMKPEDVYDKWANKLTGRIDREIEAVRTSPYRTPEDKKKRIKTLESKKNRELNSLPHYIAMEMRYKQNNGQYGGDHYKGELQIPTGTSEYYQRMLEQDGDKSGGYWSSPEEMFARVFESYIEDTMGKKKRKNNYLVYDTKTKAPYAPFPQGKERAHMTEAMKNLVNYVAKYKVLKKALEMELIKGYLTGATKRNAYNVEEGTEPIIYIPLNRLKTPYQTDKATNWDKVDENIERMRRGENLEPIQIGLDYDIHDGHHRYIASHDEGLGYSHVPCVVRGGNDMDRKRAIEAYQEVWKSFDEAKHPRDARGEFTTVYHVTDNPYLRFDPHFENRQQEMGKGFYVTTEDSVGHWHKDLKDPSSGDRRQFVIPLNIEGNRIIHEDAMPETHVMAKFLRDKGYTSDAVRKLKPKGDTFDRNPIDIVTKREWAQHNGYDGIEVHKDPKEGRQIVLFHDNNVDYQPAMTIGEFMRMRRGLATAQNQ